MGLARFVRRNGQAGWNPNLRIHIILVIGQFELMMSGCMEAAAILQVMRTGFWMIGWEVWRRWLIPCFLVEDRIPWRVSAESDSGVFTRDGGIRHACAKDFLT
jgi:hypothetical protein